MMYKLLFWAALAASLNAKPTEIIASVYVAPQLQFELKSGTVIPHDVIMCKFRREPTTYGDHTDYFIVGTCDNGVVLKLDNILLPVEAMAVKVDSIHNEQ
jgi:hypothetical protein